MHINVSVRFWVLLILTLAFGFFVDWTTKRWALSSLQNESVSFFGDWVTLKLTFNDRLFGLFPADGVFIVMVTLVALGFFLYIVWSYASRMENRPLYYYAVGFVVLGAVANLFDRFHYGAVVDWIGLGDISIINLADIFVGFGLLALSVLALQRPKVTKELCGGAL